MPIISIIVPVYNAESTIGVLASLIEDCVSVDYELILVNDCSRDESWDVIQKLVNINKRFKGLNLRKNVGQDNAIMAGFSVVSGDYVVIMDDDLQHSPADIMALYSKCREGYDICYAHFPKREHKKWKIFGSWFNGVIAQIMLGKPKNIYLSPYKIISGDLVKEVVSYCGPYPYIDGLLLSHTEYITSIDVMHYERASGKSNYSLQRSLSVWARHVTGYSVLPLRAAIYVGMTAAMGGFFLGAYYLLNHLVGGVVVEGWTTLVVLILFFSGLVLVFLGVLGEYVGRSFLTINVRPQYSIRNKVESE